jgi:RNA polymerase sigma-32 factor
MVTSGRQPNKPLPDEQVRALCRQYQASGDMDAFRRVVESNLGLAHRIARSYRYVSVDFDDLFQESVLGLIRGVELYDPNRSERITTYVRWWCRAFVGRYILRTGGAVRFGSRAVERQIIIAIKSARRFGDHVDAGQIAEATGSSLDDVYGVLARMGRDMSLENRDGEPLPIADQRPNPEDVAIEADELKAVRERVNKALASLPPREALIVRRRVMGEEKVTLDEIGRELGLSRQRVQQLEQHAMKRLKRALAA